MLHVPTAGSSCATLIGIDPGSTCVGISVMKIDVVLESIISTNANTLHLDKLGGNDWVSELYGDRFKRIGKLKECLTSIYNQEKPLCISVEAPFFNHFRPQAYGVLMEVMSCIRSSVLAYDLWMAPYLIDPSSVKNAVGAGGAAKKEVMHEKVLKLPNINPIVNLEKLDEHSIDAIAVNYARFKRLFGKG